MHALQTTLLYSTLLYITLFWVVSIYSTWSPSQKTTQWFYVCAVVCVYFLPHLSLLLFALFTKPFTNVFFVSFWKMLFFFLELGSHHLWSSFFSISHISLKIDDSSMNDYRRQPLMSDRVLKRVAKTLSLVLVRMINTNKNKTSNNCSHYTKQLLSGVV